jgi:hypothetical protein
MLMVYATRLVLLRFARWPRSSRLLGEVVGPGSHFSSQCPVHWGFAPTQRASQARIDGAGPLMT